MDKTEVRADAFAVTGRGAASVSFAVFAGTGDLPYDACACKDLVEIADLNGDQTIPALFFASNCGIIL